MYKNAADSAIARYWERAIEHGASIRIGRLRFFRRGVVKWMRKNAITLTQLEKLIAERRVDCCIAYQQPDGWFTVLTKLARENDARHLVTFRQLSKPRRFRRMDVVFKLLHDKLGYNRIIQVLPYSRSGVAKQLQKR